MILKLSLVALANLVAVQTEYECVRPPNALGPVPGFIWLPYHSVAMASLAILLLILAHRRIRPISPLLRALRYAYCLGCRTFLAKMPAKGYALCQDIYHKASLHQLSAIATSLALFVLVGGTGCSPAPDTTGTAQPDNPVATDGQSAYSCHPKLHRAILCTQALDDSRRSMELTLASMTQSIDTVQTSIEDKARSIQSIGDIATELIEMSDTLASQYEELVATHEQFEREHADAPQVYREAARVWQEYAMEERKIGEPEIAERYDEIAQLWNATAAAHEQNVGDPFSITELDRVMIYIGRSRLLLTRLLASAPLSTEDQFREQRARFIDNVQAFIDRFDRLRDTILGLTQRLQEKADSQAPSTTAPISLPAPPTNGRTAACEGAQLWQAIGGSQQPHATQPPGFPTLTEARLPYIQTAAR